jgi:hypothetical protein
MMNGGGVSNTDSTALLVVLHTCQNRKSRAIEWAVFQAKHLPE